MASATTIPRSRQCSKKLSWTAPETLIASALQMLSEPLMLSEPRMLCFVKTVLNPLFGDVTNELEYGNNEGKTTPKALELSRPVQTTSNGHFL